MLALLLALATAPAIEPEIVVREWQPAGGLQQILVMGAFDIADDGTWTAKLADGHPTLGWDWVVVEGTTQVDTVLLRPGDVLSNPPGAVLVEPGIPAVSADGALAQVLTHEDPVTGQLSSTLYIDGVPVLREGDPAVLPGLPAGSTWGAPSHVVRGSPDIAAATIGVRVPGSSTTDLALVRLVRAPSGVFQPELVAREGDTLPGSSDPIASIHDTPFHFDVAASGDVVWSTIESTGAWDDDTLAVWNQQELLREGDPFPGVLGETVESLVSPFLQTNAQGTILAIASGSGTHERRWVDLTSGQTVLMRGDPLAGGTGLLAGVQYARSIALADNGTWATVTGIDEPAVSPHPGPDGLVANGRVILRVGDPIDGFEVGYIPDTGARISPNGRWLMAGVSLREPGTLSSEPAWVRFDLAGLLEPQAPAPGTPGTLNTFLVEHAVPGHEVVLGVGARRTGSTVSCDGQPLDLDLGGAIRLLGRGTADATGTVSFDVPIPPRVAGRTLHLQAVDLTACAASLPVSFTP